MSEMDDFFNFGPQAEIERVVKHCNLNASQAVTYRYLAGRCLEQHASEIRVTAVQIGEWTGVSQLAAAQRLKSLLSTGLIHKLKATSGGTVLRVALRLDEVGTLENPVAAEPPVEVAPPPQNQQVLGAVLGLLRRSGVALEPLEVYQARLREAQDDVSFFYQIVQNYDALVDALREG